MAKKGTKMDVANRNKNDSIDIVIPWVDSNDPLWQKEKQQYAMYMGDGKDTRDIRYRDWDNLEYVFRSIEKCAPWVNKIHFVTCGQIPSWMETANPKLHIVDHSDYIPEKYLPTFSSHVIELNMHRIQGLSEKFIYFNDDIFLLRDTKPSDFFRGDVPCDANIQNLIIPSRTSFAPIVFNCVAYINKYFNKRENLRTNIRQQLNIKYGWAGLISFFAFSRWENYTGFYNHHLAVPYLKKTLETVWEKEPEILNETCTHKFRDRNDVNQYLFRYWQLASGRFYPHGIQGRSYMVGENNRKIINYIRGRKGKMVCINDHDFQGDFENVKESINSELKKLYPCKSSFEK